MLLGGGTVGWIGYLLLKKSISELSSNSHGSPRMSLNNFSFLDFIKPNHTTVQLAVGTLLVIIGLYLLILVLFSYLERDKWPKDKV